MEHSVVICWLSERGFKLGQALTDCGLGGPKLWLEALHPSGVSGCLVGVVAPPFRLKIGYISRAAGGSCIACSFLGDSLDGNSQRSNWTVKRLFGSKFIIGVSWHGALSLARSLSSLTNALILERLNANQPESFRSCRNRREN